MNGENCDSNFSTDIHFIISSTRNSTPSMNIDSNFCLRIFNSLEEIDIEDDKNIEETPRMSYIKRNVDCISELSI